MKATLSTAVFLNELQTAARVASSRSAVQALSGVQLDVSTDMLELRATDMEVGLRLRVPAEDTSPGAAVLPARLLLDIMRALPSAQVALELRAAAQAVTLVSGQQCSIYARCAARTSHISRVPGGQRDA